MRSFRSLFFLLPLVVLIAVPACSKQPAAPPSTATTPPAGAAQPAAAAQPGQTVTGPVAETMDAASYTYVRVKTESGDVWAAAPQFPVKVGDRVVVALEMPMKNFHSQSLNRDFPVLYFVSKIGREGETAAVAAPPSMMSGHGSSSAAAAPATIEPMTPPPGGMSIAQLWADRKSLAGKTVTVRGRVVKFNGGILGKNWIHLQDGTGKESDSTHDITVTTGEDVNVKVGDTITVSGTVVLDKDLGSGYAYPAVIENARLAGK